MHKDSNMCVTACTENSEEASGLLNCGWVELSKDEYEHTKPWINQQEEASPDMWDEMAVAYKKGVQEA